jgi:hypothetical protein
MTYTLPVNIDTTYSDAGDASVKLHQQYHDRLHARYNEFIDVEKDGGAPSGTGADASAAINAILSAAPTVGSGAMFTLLFRDADYRLDSGLVVPNDRAVQLIGKHGKTTPDGTSKGTRLLAGNNNLTLLRVGDGTQNFYNGPVIEDLNFHNNLKTGITGLKLFGVNSSRINRPSFYGCRYGLMFERDQSGGTGPDGAFNVVTALYTYHIGEADTDVDCAAVWVNGGGANIFLGGNIDLRQPLGTLGETYGFLLDDAHGGSSAANSTKATGIKIEANRASGTAHRTTGWYSKRGRYNEAHAFQLEALGTAYRFGGSFPSGSNGRGNIAIGGGMGNIHNGFVFDSDAAGAAVDHIGLESTVTNLIVDNSNGQNHIGRLYGTGNSLQTGCMGADKENLMTNTTYTLIINDRQRRVMANNASAITITVPPGVFPVGDWVEITQYGAGQVTLSPGAGVTLRSRGSMLKTNGQYAVIRIYQRALNEWIVEGDRVA